MIALAVRVLNDGDAIGNDVLGMARALREIGHEVSLFAEKTRIAETVRPFEELFARLTLPDQTIIYHHSNDCESLVQTIESCPARVIVKYHNSTPGHFFNSFDANLPRETERGRQQAIRMAKRGIPFWVDSRYNGEDLKNDVPNLEYQVVPPYHQCETLSRTQPCLDRLSGLDDWLTTILMVGRVAPNKNLELAIDALAELRTKRGHVSRLIVAGEHLFPTYSETLLERAKTLGVEDALEVTGRVSNGQLKALYQSADVLLTTSKHEGFCVPLVEAMALGVPIVATPNTAIPETAGDAAILATDAPALADAILQLVSDGPLRERQISLGYQRYRSHFSTPSINRRFHELVQQTINSLSSFSSGTRSETA